MSQTGGCKNLLNNYCQGALGTTPEYANAFQGPQHAGIWYSSVYINKLEYGRGSDRTQFGAQEKAALSALRTLGVPV
ncbi:hypothetical protein L218DRAFT_967490 [Marasmius fiardii PR-910]|nr:hypothetical protein L218DRAFT_967490 [Marasmius fiardii PR-910]